MKLDRNLSQSNTQELTNVPHSALVSVATTVKPGNLTLFHLNVQCLRNKTGEQEAYINSTWEFSFICLNEHWLCSDEVNEVVIEGYQLLSFFCRQIRSHGGVSVYAKNDIASSCKNLNLLKYCSETHCEFAGILYQDAIIITVYTSPAGDNDVFLQQMCTTE